MRRALTLNYYFVLAVSVGLVLTLTASLLSWTSALEERGALLRESRFEFSLSNVKSAIELGLRLGLLLPDLPGTQELIERNRMLERGILSIDIFDLSGRIVFTTDNAGVSANIPPAWLAPCLSSRENWHSQDEESNVLCAPVINGYDRVDGGVILRYRLPDRASTFGALGNYWAPALAALLMLTGLGSLAGWLALRRTERRLNRQTAALQGVGAASNDTLVGPLATGIAALTSLENELTAIDREADRLDNLN
jgi:hypothetical protein